MSKLSYNSHPGSLRSHRRMHSKIKGSLNSCVSLPQQISKSWKSCLDAIKQLDGLRTIMWFFTRATRGKLNIIQSDWPLKKPDLSCLDHDKWGKRIRAFWSRIWTESEPEAPPRRWWWGANLQWQWWEPPRKRQRHHFNLFVIPSLLLIRKLPYLW